MTAAQEAPARRRPTSAVVLAVVAWTSLAVFVVAGLGSALLGRSVFLGTDLMQRWAPWNALGLDHDSVTNIWVGDTLDSAVPQSVLVKHSVLAGDLDLWNPYLAGGNPLGSIPDTGLFSPVSWVWFLVPDSYAPGAAKLVEILVAVVGFVLLGRRLRLSGAAQAVAGLVFVSSGFMIAWTNWPQTRVAALIPLLFWAVDRAVVHRRARDAVAVALVLGSMLLGGFPAVVGYAVYAVVAYAVVRLAAERAPWREWLRAIGVGVLGAVLGAAVSAWQLLPFALNATSSLDLASRAQTSSMHLGLDSLATALVPGILGGPDDGTWVGTGNPIERFSYLGVGALVLVAVTLVVRRRGASSAVALYALGGAAVCVLLVYVGGPFLGAAQQLPVFSDNLVTRLRVMLGFFVALGAGLGFDALTRGVARRRAAAAPDAAAAGTEQPAPAAPARRGRAVLVGGVVLLAAGSAATVWVVRQTLYLVPAERIDQVRTSTLVVGAVAAVCLGLALLARTRRTVWRTVAGVVFPVVLAGQAVVVVDGWWPRSDPETFYPTTPTHEFLADHLDHERYISVGQTGLPGTSSYYRLRAANGHGFHSEEWKTLLQEAEPDAMLSPTYSVTSMEGLTSPALDRLAVRYAIADPGQELDGTLEETAPATGSRELSGDAEATVDVVGEVRGALVTLPGGVSGGERAGLRVAVLGEDGTEVAVTERPTGDLAPGSQLWVALAGEQRGDQAVSRLRVQATAGSTVGVGTAADGAWSVDLVRPADDGLDVVHSGDATVYERSTALDRFRWASRARVEPDADRRTALLGSGRLADDEVVLSEGEPRTDPGSGARIAVVADEAERIELDVTADGAGYAVVADALTGGGWTATVDGEPVDLVVADQAVVAVALDAGEHRVVLAYEAPGWRAGWAVALAGWAGVLALVVPTVVQVVRRRRADGATGAARAVPR